MSAVFEPTRVEDKRYFSEEGHAYDRVTSVLDTLGGMGSPASAAAMMIAKELQTAASDILANVPPRATECTNPGNFTHYLASDDGKKWANGRYHASLGDYADLGTIVDLGFQQIVEGAWFDEEDAINWVEAEVEGGARVAVGGGGREVGMVRRDVG